MKGNAIQIRALEKHFRRFHLGPLDLTVPEGAVYGLIGPNGAGKTTTLDLILGLGREDAGSIKVLGLDHRLDEVAMKQQVGYASPDVLFHAWGKVGKLLQFVRGFYPSWDDDYCRQLLSALNLELDERIKALSFGGRVKLGLVVALAWRPKLLILDEPTAGLDAVSKKQIFSELLSAVQDEERTVLISSHNLADLERFADHIGMIKDGKLLLEGPTSEVVERFQMIDFVSEADRNFAPAPGFFVQKHESDRWQALVDTRQNTPEVMAARGARQITCTPVTLEDVFVALARQ
jgi:ABC-2 type transport system ATP-binding protein